MNNQLGLKNQKRRYTDQCIAAADNSESLNLDCSLDYDEKGYLGKTGHFN